MNTKYKCFENMSALQYILTICSFFHFSGGIRGFTRTPLPAPRIKYHMKMKVLGLKNPNYFIYMGYLRKLR